ncbi:MAG: hypothetical protein GX220_00970 [Treponema sp.]|nr:hypothetical protein [Treponema sp.]
MKKIVTLLFVLVAVLLIASCTTVSPIAGATGKIGSKTGEATESFLFGLPIGGEGGIYKAAQNGSISTVGTVDLKIRLPLGPFVPFYYVTTVVSGE